MDYDRMYSTAMDQEKKAIGLVTLFILGLAGLFFLAAILLKEPVLGIEVKTLKNILIGSAIIFTIGGILPKIFHKREQIEY